MKATSVVRVMVCTGPTGGHFFPALSFVDAIQREHPEVEVHLVLNRTTPFTERILQEYKLHLHLIGFSSFQSFFSFKMPFFLLEYIGAFWNIFRLWLSWRPRLVVGFGSYGSVPGVLSAAILRIPILLHEQNAVMGQANRFLSFWADRIAISFPETRGIPFRKKVFWSGFPLRPAFWNGTEEHSAEGERAKRFRILIFGGSQGSRRLNETFLETLHALSAEERAGFAVNHIVGQDQEDVANIQEAYERLGVDAQVSAFSYRIFDWYRNSDLVISRAGAGTIFELAAFGRAAILIPYPHAYAHQRINAEYLAAQESAFVIHEQHLSPEVLRDAVSKLRDDLHLRTKFEANIRRLARPDADRALMKAGWDLLCKKNSYPY